MNILLAVHLYTPHVSGATHVVRSLALRLAAAGHHVAVLAGDPGARGIQRAEEDGIEVVRWPTWSRAGGYNVPRDPTRFTAFAARYAAQFDLVHIHNVHDVLPVAAGRAAAKAGVPLALTPHYHGTGHSPLAKALWTLWRPQVARLAKAAAAVIAVSPLERDLIRRSLGADTTAVIGHGVEEWLHELRWEPQDYVLYSGRVEKYKGVDRLARLVAQLNSRGHNLTLRVVGTGSHLKALERQLRRLKEKHRLSYTLEPPKEYKQYIETLRRARLYGLLSERELFSIPINEAHTIGVPTALWHNPNFPWAQMYAGRPKTLILHREDPDALAKFLQETEGDHRRHPAPTWREVAERHLAVYQAAARR